MQELLSKFSGILIFLSFLLTVLGYFYNSDLVFVAGIFAWVSFVILYKSLASKKIINILLILSFIGFVISILNDYKIDFVKVISINQYLLTLLIAVGFLRLVASPKIEKNSDLPIGKKSFFKTYLGIHLFGSVINLSSLIIVADKMYKKAPLTNIQVMTLTRAFSSDAYWSPFFVAFAAAIVYAPNLNTPTVIINGLVIATLGFLLTFFELYFRKKDELDKFNGYPISFETLYIPVILAILVLVTNSIYKDVKIIVLISIYSVVLTMLILLLKYRLFEGSRQFLNHINEELPKMKGELSLFIVAGMFGAVVSSILLGLNVSVPFEVFDWQVASVLLLGFIVLAFIGIHPIITIAIIGDYFAQFNHTLLAITFLMAWSTTVSTSPFSGLNLTIAARYKFSGMEVLKLNLPYAIAMYVLCSAILKLLYDYFI